MRAITPEPMVIRAEPHATPPLSLDHLRRMTDGTGILQHAVFSIPNYREGYTTDDNARALLACTLLEKHPSHAQNAAALASRYLAFLWYAFNDKAGRFRNFLDYRRNWLEDVGSDDCHGRALWALGTVAAHSRHADFRRAAHALFERALPAILATTSPRGWAFALLGILEVVQRTPDDVPAARTARTLADRLMNLYHTNRTADWFWFEDRLAYCNAVLPHALLLSARLLEARDMLDAGLQSLAWLADLQRMEAGSFDPIGSNGFYLRGGHRAEFDQQPIEAQATVSACLEAHRTTGDPRWLQETVRAFEWFLGRNRLGLSLYDPTTGGCRDGLHSDRTNQNQGAESTLAYLQAWLELQLFLSTQSTGTA